MFEGLRKKHRVGRVKIGMPHGVSGAPFPYERCESPPGAFESEHPILGCAHTVHPLQAAQVTPLMSPSAAGSLTRLNESISVLS
jgi:hypothetical protein